ncbi:MAG: ABC transporter permease [bacterium]|nr:ABC transporter permease [bacterium]
MSRFPPTITRKQRFYLGALGLLIALALWWLLTLPMFTEVETWREHSKVDGRHVFEEMRREVPRALVNPPGLDTPWNTFARAFEIGLPQHILSSTLRILLGFLLSIAVAVPLGVTMALFPSLRALINPVVSLIRPLPALAWVPLFVIWFGVDEVQKLAVIFIGSFAAALIYTLEATLKVDPDLIRAATNLGASRRQLLTRVLLPAALPNILSGMKVVLAICWTCVISAEIVGGKYGLGTLIWFKKEVSDTAAILVGMVSISLVVLAMDMIFTLLERRLVPWMFLQRSDS